VSERLRLTLRYLEALALSTLIGPFIWLLGMVPLIGLILRNVPLVAAVGVGFLAGGVATMRTLGVTIHDRRKRVAAAVICASIALTILAAIDYRSFVNYQRRGHAALNYRLTPGEIDAAIDTDLRRRTGRTGTPGYVLSAYGEGRRVLGLSVRGPALALLWLAHAATAITVAVRWSGGPAAPGTSAPPAPPGRAAATRRRTPRPTVPAARTTRTADRKP